MKRFTNEKGITLIALIITIIVMLILVAVTISVALNGGLFNNATNATTKTQKAVSKEELISAMVGAYDDNGNFDKSKVGTLPSGAKWCEETDESWADVETDQSQPTNCIITKENNKFYIDSNGTVLEEKTEAKAYSFKIVDVYKTAQDETKLYTFGNDGDVKISFERFEELIGAKISNIISEYGLDPSGGGYYLIDLKSSNNSVIGAGIETQKEGMKTGTIEAKYFLAIMVDYHDNCVKINIQAKDNQGEFRGIETQTALDEFLADSDVQNITITLLKKDEMQAFYEEMMSQQGG